MIINRLNLNGISFPFKKDNDEGIFKKPDLTSDIWVQSQKAPYNDINQWKTCCQPLKPLAVDIFEKEELQDVPVNGSNRTQQPANL